MSGKGLAAFVAGFGTGYLNNREKEEERKREERKEKRAEQEQALRMRELERQDKEAERVSDLNEEISAIPKETYGVKRDMGAEDVRAMVGGSSDAGADNYVSDEAAQHYMQNNTGADQVAGNAAYFAKEGVGSLNGMKPVQGEDGVKLADPATAKARPAWRVLEEGARKRIGSGVPQQEQLGYQALAYAQTIKSQEARDGAAKAYQQDGLDGVMKFMSEWDNEDYPVTNVRMDAGEGGYDPASKKGVVKFLGEISGKTITLKEYDLSKMPEGSTLEDAVMNDVQALTDPKTMFDMRRQQLMMRREDSKDNRAQGNADRVFDYTKERDAVKDGQWKLSHDADQAQRNFDNMMKTKNFNADQSYRGETLALDRDKLAATEGKNGDKVRDNYRQDFNAAIAAFDKSFKRDAMGNLIGNDLDSKIYSEAAGIIGNEILGGSPIAEAQTMGRRVYDEAKKSGVSAAAAYAVLKKKREGATPAAPAAAGGTGAAAVDQFFAR
jgi:hypothetical protein